MNFIQKKSLGQNFLTNQNIVRVVSESAQIREGETVLEIGPGNGVLTQKLLGSRAKVIAIEKDNRLIQILNKKFTHEIENKKLILINEDILTINISKIIKNEKYKIVANIPYYITGALLRNIFSQNNLPILVVLMIQKEVAQRVLARNGKESILSISIKSYGKPEVIKYVSRGNFSPPPNVDSAILRVSNISKDFFKKIDEEKFFQILRAGFSSKRKYLIRNLEKVESREKLEKIFDRFRIDRRVRAEDLNLDEWGKLTLAIFASQNLKGQVKKAAPKI